MNESQYAKGITAEDLHSFLKFWPHFAAEGGGISQMIIEDKDLFFGENAIPFSWCHLYELPFKVHAALLTGGFLQDENLLSIFKGMVESPSQIGAIPATAEKIGEYFAAMERPTKEQAMAMLQILAPTLAVSFSVYNSLRCILYHGCYLNELIQRVQTDDKALFDAVRIDPTVIGCKPVMERISKATLLQEIQFFAKLKAALTGKIAKREQANFQKMRLVFEVLHEAGADRLNDEQLHQLFVKELKLYSGNAIGGGNAKALRKFADTYMKKNATT